MSGTTKVGPEAVVEVLHALGASAVEDMRNKSGALIGYKVSPAIDLTEYGAALAQIEEANRAADWASLRRERDARLRDSDWTQMPDAPLVTESRSAWATYRQALRDLPRVTTDPTNPTWPDLPAS